MNANVVVHPRWQRAGVSAHVAAPDGWRQEASDLLAACRAYNAGWTDDATVRRRLAQHATMLCGISPDDLAEILSEWYRQGCPME